MSFWRNVGNAVRQLGQALDTFGCSIQGRLGVKETSMYSAFCSTAPVEADQRMKSLDLFARSLECNLAIARHA